MPIVGIDTGTVSCTFQSTLEDPNCGWTTAFNAGTQMEIGIPPNISSTDALFATSINGIIAKSMVSSEILENGGEIRRLQVCYLIIQKLPDVLKCFLFCSLISLHSVEEFEVFHSIWLKVTKST